MANVSVQIETRIKHDLSLSFQSVAGDESLNVGTLVFPKLKKTYAFFPDCDIAKGWERVLWASVFGENRRLGTSGTRIAHSTQELTLA